MSRGCVMFSANWVSGSPHRFTSYIYCDVHTEKHWHCRGVPTALLLTQPRPVCGLCACPVPAYRDSLCLAPLCSLKARVVSGLEASIPSSSRVTTKKEWMYVSAYAKSLRDKRYLARVAGRNFILSSCRNVSSRKYFNNRARLIIRPVGS